MAQLPKAIKVKWPVGPLYSRWVKGKGNHAWVHYKLKSANWYLSTLSKTLRRVGKVDRYAGVEMALDGVLTNLCAAFDAAVSVLARALETANGIPEMTRMPTESLGWDRAATLATAASFHLDCAVEVTAALSGNEALEPSGWLAQLQRLRDLSARENRLVPHWALGRGDPGQFVDVPGQGLQEPVAYLRSTRDSVEDLIDLILKDVEAVTTTGRSHRRSRSKSLPGRPLPDLSARARIVTPGRTRTPRGAGMARTDLGERLQDTPLPPSGIDDENGQ